MIPKPVIYALLLAYNGPYHLMMSAALGITHLSKNKKPSRQMSERFKYWSGRRDSNPRLTAWEAGTLPLSYARILCQNIKQLINTHISDSI